MKSGSLYLFVPLLLGLALSCAQATVKPNPMISEGAVLEQKKSVPIWGTADAGEKITVEFRGQKAQTVAKMGRWMVHVKSGKAGGPFVLRIKGAKNEVEVKDVLVGEVWVCSGQSNMQFALASADTGAADIAASDDPELRLLTVPDVVGSVRRDEIGVKWDKCSPQTSPGFSAVGYYFGRYLRKKLGVPVGLINASWGGTPAQSWTPIETLRANPQLKFWADENKDRNADPWAPGVLFDNMIHPVLPYTIAGAIWYQGESNAGAAYNYRTLFPAMIESWRQWWKAGDFTFLFVQLAPFTAILDHPSDSAWAELREAQLMTAMNLPNTGMAVITDVGDPADIHPRRKRIVGERLAYAALAKTYGQNVPYLGPTFKSMVVKGSSAILSFENIGAGLVAKDGPLTGFTIAGEDKKFYNATASIQGDRVVVRSNEVAHPVAVRMGWADYPVVNLYDSYGIPASPFRTDDFPITTGPK